MHVVQLVDGSSPVSYTHLFKILAIAFAFILWLVVYNLNDPVKTKTFTTTVTVTGRDSVVDKLSLIHISCTSCKGQRLKPSSRAVTVADKNIYEMTSMSVKELVKFLADIELTAVSYTHLDVYKRQD